jgi:hypothetical protein
MMSVNLKDIGTEKENAITEAILSILKQFYIIIRHAKIFYAPTGRLPSPVLRIRTIFDRILKSGGALGGKLDSLICKMLL